MLSEVRKQGIALVLLNHYTSEISPELRNSLFGNVGTTISFAVGALDAELYEHTKPDDLIRLPRYRAYIAVDGATKELFMEDVPEWRMAKAPSAIRKNTRSRYSRPTAEIEAAIAAFLRTTQPRPPRDGPIHFGG